MAPKDPILTKHGKSLAKAISHIVAHHKAKAMSGLKKKTKKVKKVMSKAAKAKAKAKKAMSSH